MNTTFFIRERSEHAAEQVFEFCGEVAGGPLRAGMVLHVPIDYGAITRVTMTEVVVALEAEAGLVRVRIPYCSAYERDLLETNLVPGLTFPVGEALP